MTAAEAHAKTMPRAWTRGRTQPTRVVIARRPAQPPR
jgi:hypothetical protein